MKLPVISGKEAIRAFEKAGWSIERRAKSRHIIMKKTGMKTMLQYQNTKHLTEGFFVL
ncbi:MAG: type II toxin-antitoxin system HicA family toxin [Candidatus Scalindua sp.]